MIQRYLFRVQYLFSDGTFTYEPVSVRSESETDARTQVTAATDRYRAASGATTTLTLIGVAADV